MMMNQRRWSNLWAQSKISKLSLRGLFCLISVIVLQSAPIQSSNAQAPLQPQITVPRVSAMGSAGMGGARSTSALIVNPAGMVLDNSYVVDANYFRTQTEENWLNLNITDSQTHQGRFALGLGYQTKLNGGEFTTHDAQIGVAMPIFKLGSRPVLGGATGHYIYDETSKDDVFDVDLGLMVPFSKAFSVGLVGSRLLEEDERRWGVGLGLTTQSLSAHFDLRHSVEADSSDLNIGVEGLLSSSFVARAGYIHRFAPQNSESQEMTFGVAILGLGSGRGRVNFSYSRSLINDYYIFGTGFSTYLDTRIQ